MANKNTVIGVHLTTKFLQLFHLCNANGVVQIGNGNFFWYILYMHIYTSTYMYTYS